jgi:hypothetical protein
MGGAYIAENYRRIRGELPAHIELLVAAKGRSVEEVARVIEAGAAVIGQNYVQEAQAAACDLGDAARTVQWHMIGPLQRNKVNRALEVFDVVQTVDVVRLARALNDRAPRPLPVYLEVNVGGEESKSGVAPRDLFGLLEGVAALGRLRVEGLMTMEPYCEDPEEARPCFARMRALFDEMRSINLPNVDLKVLSMGMSHSWRVAVQEGSTMVRVGTAIFGPRVA